MSEKLENREKSNSHRWVRVLVIVLITISIALLLSVDSAYQGLQRLLAEAEPLITRHPLAGAVVFVLLSALSAVLAFFSSALLVPVAVYTWGQPWTVVLLWLGWLFGGMFMFWLGRGLRGSAAGRGGPKGRFASYLPKLADGAPPFSLVLLVQLALPSEIPGYLFGYLGVPFRTYVVALALAELPYAIGAVMLGESLINREVGSLLALVAVAGVLGYLLLRALRRRLP